MEKGSGPQLKIIITDISFTATKFISGQLGEPDKVPKFIPGWEPHLNGHLNITLKWEAHSPLLLGLELQKLLYIKIETDFAKMMWNCD